jgi:hypothetical protein
MKGSGDDLTIFMNMRGLKTDTHRSSENSNKS